MEDFARALQVFFQTNDNNTREEAERFINEFKRSNYSQYLLALITIPLQIPDQTLASACLVFLFQEAKHSNIDGPSFLEPEIQTEFWPQVSTRIVPLFQAPHIIPHHKSLLLFLLVLICL